MNNKGFTLVELLATLVILGIVVGLSMGAFNFNMKKAKEKTEEVFVDTLKDAVDMYLSTEFASGNLQVSPTACGNSLKKKYAPDGDVKVYKVTKKEKALITFRDVIDSYYNPLIESEFVNPANKNVKCKDDAIINVYRDEDRVYYYSIDKRTLGCLNNIDEDYSDVITNLPKVGDGYYTCG